MLQIKLHTSYICFGSERGQMFCKGRKSAEHRDLITCSVHFVVCIANNWLYQYDMKPANASCISKEKSDLF